MPNGINTIRELFPEKRNPADAPPDPLALRLFDTLAGPPDSPVAALESAASALNQAAAFIALRSREADGEMRAYCDEQFRVTRAAAREAWRAAEQAKRATTKTLNPET